MAKLTFKTKTVNPNDINEEWFLIDAKGKRMGNVASKAAEMLLGKHNPLSRDYLLPKTKVVIINAELLDLTEVRKISKLYKDYSGYPGGLKVRTLEEVMAAKPIKALERAIKGMLPKNRRGKAIFGKNLFVYPQAEHKQEAQQPQEINLADFKV